MRYTIRIPITGQFIPGLKEIYYVVKDINEEEVSDRYDILVNGEPDPMNM